MPHFTLILDSNEFLYALLGKRQPQVALLKKIREHTVYVPPLIAAEIKDNLRSHGKLIREFNKILYAPETEIFIPRLVPPEKLVQKYIDSGLSKADATIAAYTDALEVDYLISENRHFLKQLKTDVFKVSCAKEFLKILC